MVEKNVENEEMEKICNKLLIAQFVNSQCFSLLEKFIAVYNSIEIHKTIEGWKVTMFDKQLILSLCCSQTPLRCQWPVVIDFILIDCLLSLLGLFYDTSNVIAR